MYVSVSMKNYLIWKKTLKLTQMKIWAAEIKVIGPIDVAYIFVLVYADQNNFRMYLILFSYPK